jgi:hypothetical protein
MFSDEGGPLVREATWQRSIDLDRLFEKVRDAQGVVAFRPTITVRDAPVPPERFTALIQEASDFHLPVLWFDDRASFTLDIGSVGFEVFGESQPPAVLRLEWSADKPRTWEPVIAWHNEVRKFLEGCFTTKGSLASPTGIQRHLLWDEEVDGRTSIKT